MSKKLNILVCGYTGIGKTSLVNCLTGGEIVPQNAMGDGTPKTKGVDIYEYHPFRFLDAEGIECGKFEENKKMIHDEISKRFSSENLDETIHAVIYCIAGSGARTQQSDFDYLKEIMHLKPIIVFTKGDIIQKEQKLHLKEAVNSRGFQSFFISVKTREGVNELVSHFTHNLEKLHADAATLLQKYRDVNEQETQSLLNARNEEADSYIRWGTGRAFGIALATFIPLADLPLLLANESWMFYKLADVYKITATEALFKSFLGLIGASFGGKLLASFFPGVKAVVAGSVTYGVGKAMKAFFESSGNITAEELKAIKNKATEEAKKQDLKKLNQEAQKYS